MAEGSLIRTLLAPWHGQVTDVAQELVRAGWAEAGAGNITLPVEARAQGEELRLPLEAPALRDRALLVSGAGTRMRAIARDPVRAFGLLVVGPEPATGRWLGPVRPTSELAVHLAVHDTFARENRPFPCLLHAHPTALIALTRLVSRPEDLLALLAPPGNGNESVHDRLAVTSPLPPGSVELARATAAVITRNPGVVWPGHGMLAVADSLDAALDLVQTADKAAAVALATLRPGPAARRQDCPRHTLKSRPAPWGIESRYEVRTRDSALAPEAFARLPRRPVHLVLDNLRSAFNVGSVFRLADACRCAEVICCGYTSHPPHHKLEQAALGATRAVPWRSVPDVVTALEELRDAGVRSVAVETAECATPYYRFDYSPPVALVLGNEAHGLPARVLAMCDGVVDIPVAGFKNSVNVAAAAGIVLYDLCRRQGWLETG